MSQINPGPSDPTPPPTGATAAASDLASPGPDAKTWGMIAHLSGLVGFIGPLIVWLVKKGESAFVDDQAKESLNFQITVAVALIICGLLTCVFIGVFLIPVVGLGSLILLIMAALKAKDGVAYRYPLTLRLVK